VAINKHTTFIIIPVYNEGEIIRQTVQSFINNGWTKIIIVDDGSSPQVSGLLRHMPIVVLRHSINLGQGAALQTGITYARRQQAEAVVTFDADGQHDINDLPSLLEPVVSGEADVALGSRFLKPAMGSVPFSRKLVLQMARVVNFLFSGLLLSDAHNGLRAFNNKALENIQVTQNRMAHASEILFEIKRKGLRYKEVPVTIHYTKHSRAKGQSMLNSVNILFDLIFKKSNP
jgi:polyprenyl-phospho-N-acetylgalactosaminyl synthase